MSTIARIRWISGPVLRAVTEGVFQMREAVEVGETRLLGEVIRIEGEEIVVQVYEDTTGLKPGVEVHGSGRPLSVPLGPGLLGNIFDGLLRPLAGTGSPYVLPGLRAAPPLSFVFTPTVKPGKRLESGAVFGTAGAAANEARSQKLLIPPNQGGEVIQVAAAGSVDEDAPLLTLRGAEGKEYTVAMRHDWPVRAPRPVIEHLANDKPLLTGQRIVDSIFPVALGGRAAIPGGFGTGKTILLETLAKWCTADVIVYVGCGERGNEISGVLEEFPELEDARSGRKLMERTVIIANTSNMPVSAREASIYTGVTVAEYFRDQGLHVALMADSTSRWAEALREVSGRLGELPGEGAYPAYLSSRLAEFYERAGRVTTLSRAEGSVTIMGSISPPSGDFSEPVTSHTKRYIRSFWALDVKRAQARFYPAIHPLQSYSEDVGPLGAWWQATGNARWPELRRRFLTLLEDQARLDRMARIIGKDAMPPRQQVVLACAELVNEAFLRQSAYSPSDRYCSPERQTAMMKLLARFIEQAEAAVAEGMDPGALAHLPVYRKLARMGEDLPEEALEKYEQLATELEQAFTRVSKADAHAADR
ncbi:MAG TPA: V-type ATP synthase subunit A [Sulfuricaulis sp.]